MATATASSATTHPMPFVRLELALLTVAEGALQVLLGRRSENPFAGRMALPGGVLRVDLDADLEAGCRRVAHERLGVELPAITQVGAVGGKKRDPRANWALSVVYRCLLPQASVQASPGKRLDQVRWVPADEAAADSKLAFDHGRLIGAAVDAVRLEFNELRFPHGFLPDVFTLTELKETSEAVLGRHLDKSSFRRRIDAAGVVQPVDGAVRTGANRPAQLYELARLATETRGM